MGLMSDFFKRGYLFDGSTGLKTGANLEDLITRAVPVVGSQLVDQSSLETYADGTITDDGGVAINRLRVKAGGITSAMLAANAMWGDPITLNPSNIVKSGFASLTDWTNMLDDDDSTATAEFSFGHNEGHGFYWDLGSAHQGFIKMLVELKVTGISGGTVSASCQSAYDNTDFFGNTVGGSGVGSFYLNTPQTTYHKGFVIVPFYGRYVGANIETYNTTTGYVKFYRFSVYGRAI